MFRNASYVKQKDKTIGAHTIEDVLQPSVVQWYDWGMGGTDLLDQLLSYYRTGMKTKRLPRIIIIRVLLCSAANAWLLGKMIHGITNKHTKFGNVES